MRTVIILFVAAASATGGALAQDDKASQLDYDGKVTHCTMPFLGVSAEKNRY